MNSIYYEIFPNEKPKDNHNDVIVEVGENGLLLSFNHQEIWDGSNLAKLRSALAEAQIDYDITDLSIDITGVKSLSSGFFGLLAEYYDKGINVYLKSPDESIMQEKWFKMFLKPYPRLVSIC